MIDVYTVLPVVLGVAILFAGATLSRYGVATVGALLGGGGGYLLAPTLATALGLGSIAAVVASVIAGVAAGVAVTYLLFSFAVAGVSFVLGTFVGLAGLGPMLVDGAWYVEAGAAVGIGLVAAVFGLVLTRTTTIILTSFVGAALASRAVTVPNVETAQATTSVDPLLFDVTGPVFLALFCLGILTQFGLFRFGYVTRIVKLFPGANGFRSRGRTGKSGQDQKGQAGG